jgi:hypothetical protein
MEFINYYRTHFYNGVMFIINLIIMFIFCVLLISIIMQNISMCIISVSFILLNYIIIYIYYKCQTYNSDIMINDVDDFIIIVDVDGDIYTTETDSFHRNSNALTILTDDL